MWDKLVCAASWYVGRLGIWGVLVSETGVSELVGAIWYEGRLGGETGASWHVGGGRPGTYCYRDSSDWYVSVNLVPPCSPHQPCSPFQSYSTLLFILPTFSTTVLFHHAFHITLILRIFPHQSHSTLLSTSALIYHPFPHQPYSTLPSTSTVLYLPSHISLPLHFHSHLYI